MTLAKCSHDSEGVFALLKSPTYWFINSWESGQVSNLHKKFLCPQPWIGHFCLLLLQYLCQLCLKDLRQRTTLNDMVPKSCSCWYGPFSFLSLEWWEACLCVCVCHDCDCNSWPKWNHANQISLSSLEPRYMTGKYFQMVPCALM